MSFAVFLSLYICFLFQSFYSISAIFNTLPRCLTLRLHNFQINSFPFHFTVSLFLSCFLQLTFIAEKRLSEHLAFSYYRKLKYCIGSQCFLILLVDQKMYALIAAFFQLLHAIFQHFSCHPFILQRRMHRKPCQFTARLQVSSPAGEIFDRLIFIDRNRCYDLTILIFHHKKGISCQVKFYLLHARIMVIPCTIFSAKLHLK